MDVAFDDSRVPGKCAAGDDGLTIAVNAYGESVETGKVILPDGVDPLREPFALALGGHGREGSDVSGEGLQFRALSEDRLESQLLDFGEGFGAAEDPLGDCSG
ncbi:hypothetical protein MOV08_39095 [Streptomyces yunnanensis]|uniref:DUF397 domain-containing protein n=1 Tax=Streptomyces yunnanensis TaxID=156453 RepID=A0ABY8AMG8_9ACTN|nr:hypothetical protein [Streptomyces yunnanensis]WEB46138.1 hypothetical protein MOV08_39095 [Streptomyces yunnanensis]